MKKTILLLICTVLISCANKENITITPPINKEVESKFAYANLLCVDFENCKNAEEALAILDELIETDKNFLDAYEIRSVALTELGYYLDALDDITYAIRYRARDDENLSQSYTRRSYIYDKLGNELGAKKDLEMAKSIK